MTASTSPTSSGSSAEVGSSKSISFGSIDSDAGDGDALLLAAGELRRDRRPPCRPCRPVPGCARATVSASALRPLEHLALRDGEVLQHGQVREQVERLEDHADAAAHRVDVARPGR